MKLRERGGASGQLKKRELTGGPGLSAGEREGKWEEASWAWPRKRKGGARGQLGQAGQKEGKGKKVSIFFSKYF